MLLEVIKLKFLPQINSFKKIGSRIILKNWYQVLLLTYIKRCFLVLESIVKIFNI